MRDDDPGGAKRVEEGIRFVDRELGFEIQRPAGSEWSFAHGHEAPGGIQVPVIVSHAATGAQVVVQVAPQVAPAQEFAERLAVGLRTKQGFTTTVPEATANGSNFLFSLGDQIHGRVAVIASDDRLYVLLGTWPASAPSNVARDVDAIMRSLRTAVITEATR
ncbi:putative lipoprotein [Vulgatibacter incomptus]|uniref:Putative lipoprotein n=1 Tax=Vulgatibacter incomptus TaxID=1391653 RepID=A0A0K1PDY8_9BACT|nr:putative lipoprotein [Vulgatibacter incomptus]